MSTPETVETLRMPELRQHAWDYFQYHASQRTTIFNFYLIICALLATGYFHAMATAATCGLGIVLGLLLPLLSFVFWKLDQRNEGMVKIAEEALMALEGRFASEVDGGLSTTICVFSIESKQTNEAAKKKVFWSWKNHYGHHECFFLIFASNFGLGFAAALYALSVACR